MKSIVEEASSIAKAIEKAWERAERPQEFSIKIFEDAERGFLGMTKKQAKVGIFFAEQAMHIERSERPRETHERVIKTPEKSHLFEQKKPDAYVQKKKQPHKPTVAPSSSSSSQAQPHKEHKERRSAWTDDMKKAVETWLVELLRKSNLAHASFAAECIGNKLHITFSKPVFDSQEKNTLLFRSLSYLLLGMLRSRFKKEFRFLKIVLTVA